MINNMIPNVDLETPALKPCATVDNPFTSDLTWLMHRAVRVLTNDFDTVCVEFGLKDMRDTLVLAVCGDGIARTQIGVSATLGLDKTTLMGILDRLEGQGFLVREINPQNRRVRIPKTTPTGQAVLERVLEERDKRVAKTLTNFDRDEIKALRTQLWRIATAHETTN